MSWLLSFLALDLSILDVHSIYVIPSLNFLLCVKGICSILTMWVQILASPLTKCGTSGKYVTSQQQNWLHEELIHSYIMKKTFLSTYYAPGTIHCTGNKVDKYHAWIMPGAK